MSRTVWTRAGLTALTLAFFGLALRAAPFMEGERPERPAPKPRAAETSLGLAAPSESELIVNGFPLTLTRNAVDGGCDEPPDPAALGLCSGEDCQSVERMETEGATTFAWRDEEADRVQAATLLCGADGRGALVEMGIDESLTTGDGEFHLELPEHRTLPIPSLPETRPVADLQSGGFRVFLDRSADPRLDLERLHLALAARGWVSLPTDDSTEPPSRVLLRNGELALLTVQIDGSSSFLISAYSRPGWASKESHP